MKTRTFSAVSPDGTPVVLLCETKEISVGYGHVIDGVKSIFIVPSMRPLNRVDRGRYIDLDGIIYTSNDPDAE